MLLLSLLLCFLTFVSSSKYYGNAKKRFLTPEFIDIKEHFQYLERLTKDAETECILLQITPLIEEFKRLSLDAILCRECFKSTERKLSKSSKHGILLNFYTLTLMLERSVPLITVALSRVQHDYAARIVLRLGIRAFNWFSTMNSIDKSKSDFPFIQQILPAHTALATEHTLENLECVVELMSNLLRSGAIRFRDTPARLTMLHGRFKLAHCLFHVALVQMKRHGITFVNAAMTPLENLIESHYMAFGGFLFARMNKNKLKLEEVMSILSESTATVYVDFFLGIFEPPKCPYLRDFLLHGTELKTILGENSTMIEYAFQKYYDEKEAEIARFLDLNPDLLKAVAVVPPSPPKSKKSGKTAGKRKNGKQANSRKKTPAPSSSRSSPSSTHEISRIVASNLSNSNAVHIDEREKSWATVMLGQYLMDRYLTPLLDIFGVHNTGYSWDQIARLVEDQLASGLNSTVSKAFLLKCIEWVRRRNIFAHPAPLFPTPELWHDLAAINSHLSSATQKRLERFLVSFDVPKPEKPAPKLSGFGRANMGISDDIIIQSLASIRLWQFLYDSTIARACNERKVEATLPNLKNWTEALSFLFELPSVDASLIQAMIQLLEVRNGFAHPLVRRDTIAVLVESVLFQDPDYETFLKHLK